MLQQMRMTTVSAMHSVSCGSSHFPTIWCRLSSLFIDDLCVDASTRGQHIGEKLFVHVKEEAKRLGCYEVTLNVWAGNTSAGEIL